MNRTLIAAITLAVVAAFAGHTVGYIAGTANGQASMAAAVKVAHALPNSSTEEDLMNALVFSQYMNGEIDEEGATAMLVTSAKKTLEVLLSVPGWGTITITPYDPHEDPHAKPDSPYGTSSCIEEEPDGSIDCAIVEKSKVKCVISMRIEKGPVAGTYFFVKQCDGSQIAHRVKKPFDGYIVHYDTLIHAY